MWGTNLTRSQTEDSTRRNPWHNEAENQQEPLEEVETPPVGIDESDDNRDGDEVEGTWGEKDVGHPNTRLALEEFEALRETLTSLSRTRSHAQAERSDGLFQTVSRKSAKRAPTRGST